MLRLSCLSWSPRWRILRRFAAAVLLMSLAVATPVSTVVPLWSKWASFGVTLAVCLVVTGFFWFSTAPYHPGAYFLIAALLYYTYLTTLRLSNVYVTAAGFRIEHALRPAVERPFASLRTVDPGWQWATLVFADGGKVYFYPPLKAGFRQLLWGDDSLTTYFRAELAKQGYPVPATKPAADDAQPTVQ